jgi:uncharacterized protein YbjT (DUF2867 family)
MTVLAVGATGAIGSEIVRALAAQSTTKLRIATRDVERTRAAFGGLAQIEPVMLDWQRPQTLDAALEGVSRVVLVNAMAPDMAAQTTALVEAAHRAGISLLVRFSLLGAGEADPIEEARWHDAADEIVRHGRFPWVIIKPNQYFQNWVNAGTVRSVRADGALYLPYADSQVSSIDTRDLGEIAARVLLADPSAHAGREYVLTGGTAQTMDQVAAAIGAALDRPIRYVAVSEEVARQGMTRAGLPPVTIEAILGWFAFCRAGRAARIEPASAALLQRSPRGVADFARDYAHRYRD